MIKSVELENVFYGGEVCTSFKPKGMSTVHIHSSIMIEISLEHGLQPAEPDVSSQSAYDKCLSNARSHLHDGHTIRHVVSTGDIDGNAQSNG